MASGVYRAIIRFMSETSSHCTAVVGGGLAGIVTALILARRGNHVTLIEAADTCGGLLQSFHNDDGVPFDYGTHILKETGIAGLDELLFGDFTADDWQWLDRLRVGGYFGGELYPTSQFVDLRKLPGSLRQKAAEELLALSSNQALPAANARAHAELKYGPTITNEVLEPLMGKLYGCPLSQLEPAALALVGYSRFILFDRERTRELKKDPVLDGKLGFTTWDDGISPLMNFYPTSAGVHIWLDALLNRLRDLNVTILTGTSVTGANIDGQAVRSVELSNGTTLQTDELYWTVSPAFLLKAAGRPFPQGINPPQFRSTALVNLVFDRNFNTDLYFYYCHDPQRLTYRTTFYSNLRSKDRGSAPYNCTVEVMSDEATVTRPDLSQQLLTEMRAMNLVGPDHRVTYQKVISSPKGFPLPTTGYARNSATLAGHCEGLARNIRLFGRATGKTHFMHEVLAEIWNALEPAA